MATIGNPLLTPENMPALGPGGLPTYYAGQGCKCCEGGDGCACCKTIILELLSCFDTPECGSTDGSGDDTVTCAEAPARSLCCHRMWLRSTCCNTPPTEGRWAQHTPGNGSWVIETDPEDATKWYMHTFDESTGFKAVKDGRCPDEIPPGDWTLVAGDCGVTSIGCVQPTYIPVYLCGKTAGVDEPDFVRTVNPPCLPDQELYGPPTAFIRFNDACYFSGSEVTRNCPWDVAELPCVEYPGCCEGGWVEVDDCDACTSEIPCGEDCGESTAPLTIRVTFEDLEAAVCEAGTGNSITVIGDPNGEYVLTQSESNPCFWTGSFTGSVLVRYYPSSGTCDGDHEDYVHLTIRLTYLGGDAWQLGAWINNTPFTSGTFTVFEQTQTLAGFFGNHTMANSWTDFFFSGVASRNGTGTWTVGDCNPLP